MRLIREYRLYNVVEWGGRYWGIPQWLGPVDLNRAKERDDPLILRIDDEAAIEPTIDREGAWEKFDPLYTPVPLTEFGPPEVVEIEPIQTCNLRCVMCHVSYERLSKRRLDPAFVRNLNGLRGKWVKLGSLYEPVAHPDFAEIARGLTEVGAKIDLISNGTLFTPGLIERIKDCNFVNVTVSFDGISKRTYEPVRRRGRFARALERTLAFKEAVKRHNPDAFFAVNYTVLRSNMHEIPDAIEFWESYDFDHLGFIAMVLRDDNPALRAESVEPVIEDAERLLDEAARRVIANRYRITVTSPHYRRSELRRRHPEAFVAGGGIVRSKHPGARLPCNPVPHFQNGPYPDVPVPCRSPYKFARISFDGTVELCYRYKIGNIQKEDLLSLWNGEKAQAVREMIKADERVCHACEYYKFCVKSNQVEYEKTDSFNSKPNDLRMLGSEDGFNFVAWMGCYFAIPQWRGEISLPLPDVAELGGLEGGSLEDVKRRVAAAGGADAAYRGCPEMKLLNTFGSLNIVYYQASFYAVQQEIGKIEAGNAESFQRPDVRCDRSYYGLLATLRREGAIPETVSVDP